MSDLTPVDADWVARFADDVIAEADRRGPGTRIVCASGLSPSGPVHLGNLREVMTPHLVVDEIRRRGLDCEHVLSWDDFDRFRKVPAGIDASWAQHIGKPLSAVPAPPGSPHPTWAAHFAAPMITSMAELGIEVRPINQTEQYLSGAYREQILHAMRERARIDSILDQYRTKGRPAAAGGGAVPPRLAGDATGAPGTTRERGLNQPDGRLSEAEAVAAREAAEGSGAAEEDDGTTASGYYPYRPYCTVCGKDFTTVTDYDDRTTALSYTCTCGHAETVALNEFNQGKLVWKVDWPMRWAYEGVLFEPSGVDHSSPGSSFVVGTEIVREVFGSTAPIGPMYAFVGISGMAKMSSSRGNVPTATDALRIMEPQLVRWLYARRQPNQSFNVAFDQEVTRLYDEWDALTRRERGETAAPQEDAAYRRAIGTATTGLLPTTPHPLPYRTLASIVDITAGHEQQTLRILSQLDDADPVFSLDEVRPRLDRAWAWVTEQVPDADRTQVRTEPDHELLASLDDQQRRGLALLCDGLDSHWSLDGLTTLVYGVPKIQLGLPPTVKPTPELKAAQRTFFTLVYHLLVGRDTGPRLPTLLLVIGAEQVRALLGVAREREE
jgi:lysyl-tRNA synthetase class 1